MKEGDPIKLRNKPKCIIGDDFTFVRDYDEKRIVAQVSVVIGKSNILTEEPALLKCDFCGKDRAAVQYLIAGPGVQICEGCVEICNEVITSEQEREKNLKTKGRKRRKSAAERRPDLKQGNEPETPDGARAT